jgi:dipeptidyl aminopeptidase/acylaminoacyl peptidase
VADGQCYLVPADGSAPPRRATDAPHPDFSHTFRPPLWSDDGSRIFGLGDNAVWAIAIAARRADRVATIPGRTIVHMVTPRETGRAWTPHSPRAGDRVPALAVWTRDVASRDEGLYRVEVETGQATRLWEGPKYAAPNHILDCDGIDTPSTLVCIAEDFQHAPDVWLVSAAHDSMRRLSMINPQLTLTDVGTTRVIDWRTGDGEQVRGLLALPPASAGPGPYPLLVSSYPRRRFSDLVNAFETRAGLPVQLLTSRGYAVLCADTPINGTDLANDVATAVLPGITKVIEMGLADPARVGVFGESGGGYDVMVLITRSSIFKAAVNLSGFADLMAFYGSFREPHQHFAIGWSELFLGGTPWTVPQRYVENSPIYALDRIQTPLLLVHGGADTGVEPHLAHQVFIGLKRLGKPVTYVSYHDEGHALRPQARLDFIERAIAWFDHHLKPQLKSPRGTVPVPTGQAQRSRTLRPH